MPNRIFHFWIPKELDLLLLLILSTMLSFTNGIPTTIATYIVNDQAGIPADISMASYAYYAGMACGVPLVLRLTNFTSKRRLLISVFSSLIFFNFILAESTSTLSIVMASFAIGGIRMFGSIAFLGELSPILMPRGERYQLYCIYYPIAVMIPAFSSFVAAKIADLFQWEMSLHFQNFLLFAGLLLIILLTHTDDRSRKIPLYQYDWLGTIWLATSLLLSAYFTTYGLTEDWFHSSTIIIGLISALCFFLLFLGRNYRVRRRLFDFSVFQYRAVPITLGTLFVLGLFYSSSSLITSFTGIIVPGNPLESAAVNTYVIWGYLIGSIFTYLWFKQTKNCRIIFSFACLCYLISNVWIYLLISSQTDPVQLFFPLFFRGMAIMISYITAGVYMGSNLPVKLFLPAVVFLLLLRSFMVPVIWSNTLANWYYHRQLVNATYLASHIDRMDAFVSYRKDNLTSVIRTQASLLALRDIYSVLIVIGAILFFIILIFPYHSSRKRRILNWSKAARIKELIQALPI